MCSIRKEVRTFQVHARQSNFDSLHSVCALIADGNVSPNIIPLLSASRLTALLKASGDVRLIAIEETLRRITARAICLQERLSFSEYFSLIQHGVATAGEAELLTHHIQLLMDQNPEWSVLKTDVSNAFCSNSISRKCLIEEISKCFPGIVAHVHQMYSKPSSLIYTKNPSVVPIQSEERIHQGNPLGPALFATAIHPNLHLLQQQHPNVTILAYLDDIYVVGPSNCCMSVLSDIKASFEKINLAICNRKCELYCPSGSFDSQVEIPVVIDGTEILETPIGSSSYVESNVLKFLSLAKIYAQS